MIEYTNEQGHTIQVNDPAFASIGERWIASGLRMAEEKREWIADLRWLGVKAAHPDDGWVDRQQNEVHLCYPQFDDGLSVGDQLALGAPGRTRIVTITGSRSLRIDPSHIVWTFEPPPEPDAVSRPRSFWVRLWSLGGSA